MPYKQATTLDFPGSHLPTRDTVLGGGAPAPSDGNPRSLHPAPGLERGVPPAYRGLGGLEGPGAPSGEEVPHNQTGPGTVDMSSPARAWSLDRPSPDGFLISPDAPLIPAHKVLLSYVSSLLPSSTFSTSLTSSTPSSTSSSSSSSSSPEALLELATSRKLEVCPICKVGRIVPEARDKENVVLYTRDLPPRLVPLSHPSPQKNPKKH